MQKEPIHETSEPTTIITLPPMMAAAPPSSASAVAPYPRTADVLLKATPVSTMAIPEITDAMMPSQHRTFASVLILRPMLLNMRIPPDFIFVCP